MKNYFAKIFGVAALAIMVTTQSDAQELVNIFIHSPNGASQSFELDNLKLIFTEQEIKVFPANSPATTLFYENVSLLGFIEPMPTGIVPIHKSEIKLYPNPVTELLNIECVSIMTSADLYDVRGKLLQRITPQAFSANLSLTAYPAGVYIVRITDKQGISVHKIIKH